MNKYFILPWMAMLISFSVVACSDDDQPQQEEFTYEPDELTTLQKNLVKTDEEGRFVERILGVSLDAADSTEVSVGVDNYEEAAQIFAQLFADTTVISNNGTLATFAVEKGKAELKKVSDTKGTVASISFDVPGLKFVSKVNFILNSAWPENASGKGFHKLGSIYQYQGWTSDGGSRADDVFDGDEMFNYVCIREYSNGIPALLVAITPKPYFIGHRFLSYARRIPSEAKALEISKILRSDWYTYQSYFDAAYSNVLTDELYWYGKTQDYGFAGYRWVINLHTGELDWYAVHWKTPRFKVLFYIESAVRL